MVKSHSALYSASLPPRSCPPPSLPPPVNHSTLHPGLALVFNFHFLDIVFFPHLVYWYQNCSYPLVYASCLSPSLSLSFSLLSTSICLSLVFIFHLPLYCLPSSPRLLTRTILLPTSVRLLPFPLSLFLYPIYLYLSRPCLHFPFSSYLSSCLTKFTDTKTSLIR